MKIFCADMDNTIIYSYKHDIGDKKINVEIYEGRELSFISRQTHVLLRRVNHEMLLIPTSTRTEEQYKRIDLKIGRIPYALVCNGGVLLIDGKRDREWYQESLDFIRESESELRKAMELLDKDSRRKFELRLIEQLFVFTKCEKPEFVVEDLKRELDIELVNIFHHREKVYVVPKNLSKGMAIRRIREKFNPEYVIAAGDSAFDVSMVEEADFGIVPHGFCKAYKTTKELMEMDADRLFSEALLEEILKIG